MNENENNARNALVYHMRSERQAIEAALPRTLGMTPDRVIQGIELAAQKNPRILQCDPLTVLSSALYIARLGLDPSGQTGEAFLVPFGRECTPMVGQQGRIDLAYRSGKIARIVTQCIYEHDHFEHDLATGECSHRVNLKAPERGELLGAYCLIWTTYSDRPVLEVMGWSEFEARIMEPAKKKNRGKLSPAYENYPGEMIRRSVLHRALKRAPKSIELADLLAAESHLSARQREHVVDADESWASVGVPRGRHDDRDASVPYSGTRGGQTAPDAPDVSDHRGAPSEPVSPQADAPITLEQEARQADRDAEVPWDMWGDE